MERRTTSPTERNRLKTTLSDAEYEYRSTDNAVNDLLNKVSALPLHKGFKAAVGATLQPGFKNIPGTDAASFMASLKGVNSATLISMIKDLKASGNGASGFGSLTEKEGEYLIQALGSLEISQDEDQYKTTVDDIVDTLNRKRGALENKWKNIYGGTFRIKSDDEKTKGDGGTPKPDQTLPENQNDKRLPLGGPGAGGTNAPI